MAKSEEGWLEAFVEEVRLLAEEDFRDRAERTLKLCESPIERVLLAAWLSYPREGYTTFARAEPLPFSSLIQSPDPTCEFVGGAYPQVVIGNHRVDFYIEAFDKDSGDRWLRLAIESDGHEFHEKTKEQARRDKSRDRRLMANGVPVIRFTGSEIWADPHSCIQDIEDAIFKAWERRYRPGRG